MIELTERAAEEVIKMQEELKAFGKGLRVEVTHGGCQGYSYEFGFDDQRPGDQKSVSGGVTLLAREDVAPLIDGMTIDFVTQMAGDAFVFKNPKAVRSCGCGNSFAV